MIEKPIISFKKMDDVYNASTHRFIVDHAYVYPDALRFMQELHYLEKKCAIVTNRDRKTIQIFLDAHMEIKCLIDVIVGMEDVKYSKPDAEPMIVCMEQLSANQADYIYFGDAYNDYLSAKNANVDFAFISRYGKTIDECKAYKDFNELSTFQN